ncbi:peptidoglycan editing factor PgeF [Notoacmeibacter marinus]|uniref:peptidoglycan editing factor PgeF n=1 Tax=Notoacmeibacter marinus TaxID=1876515 RepID=UPI000DF2362D
MKEGREMPPIIRHSALDALKGIRHGFFTRQGGVSNGIYDSLNIGVGSDDEPGKVETNRRRVADALGSDPLVSTPWQIHSPDVVTIDAPLSGERPKSDALVTKTPDVAIGVVTADCGPVLFADADAGVIGAAHAGWRGAFSGILENTVHAMEALGAERQRIVAIVGPSISQPSYEVGPEFVERFLMANEDNHRWFAPSQKTGHALFDLVGFTLNRLAEFGVQAETLGLCTYEDEHRFFSYRRTSHRGEGDYGRQISAIMLTR